jgi:hypothetical protein
VFQNLESALPIVVAHFVEELVESGSVMLNGIKVSGSHEMLVRLTDQKVYEIGQILICAVQMDAVSGTASG